MEKELEEIECFLRNEQNDQNLQIHRFDGSIGVDFFLLVHISRRDCATGTQCVLADLARMQVMVSSLMKPAYCFSLFFGSGRVEQVQGLSWLDKQRQTVIAEGAKTEAEIKEAIKLLRLKQVQTALDGMKRLELQWGTFVTEKICVTLIDPTTILKKPVLAYLPNGYGLPGAFNNYSTQNSEGNTESLVGSARGVASFVGIRDHTDERRTKDFTRSLQDSLTPQIGLTEPSLLENILQTPPIGQISQIENYQLSSCAIELPSDGIGSQDPTGKTGSGSVIEALNLLFGEKNLGKPEVQRTILLVLTRPFLLQQALTTSSKELLATAHQLSQLVVKYQKDAIVLPFLLQVGQVLRDYSLVQEGEECHQIAQTVPCFDLTLPKMQGKELSGKDWLEEILGDPDQEHASASIAYLYALMDRPIRDWDEKTTRFVLLAATSWGVATDAVGLPMFNQKVQRWMDKTVLPGIAERMKKEELSMQSICKEWMEMLLPKEKSLGPWTRTSEQPAVFENAHVKIVFSPLQILDQSTGKLCNVQRTFIPAHVQSSQQFLQLFGNTPILAEIQPGESTSQYIYTFQIDGLSYQVIYDQATTNMQILGQFPKGPNQVGKKEEWYKFCPEFVRQGETSLEQLMQTHGLWVNTQRPSRAYVFTDPSSKRSVERAYAVSLDKDGSVAGVYSGATRRKVAVMTPEEIEALVPFANGQKTLVLTSARGKVEEIHCVDQGRVFTKQKGGVWACSDPRLVPTWHWMVESPGSASAKPESHEKAFLDHLGSDAESILLPITKGSEKQYITLPYELQIPRKGLTRCLKESIAGLKTQPLLFLQFGKEGELQGSPSSLLYLSYYFAMRKDYTRAYFYLEKAAKMPAESEKEEISFQHVANLFSKIPYRTPSSVLFQLTAQLRVREITRMQFSKTLYAEEKVEQFLASARHVAVLYEVYQKNQKGIAATGKTLCDSDERALYHISHSTFYTWEKAQQKALGPILSRVIATDSRHFLDTRMDENVKEKISETIFLPALILAKDLHREIGVDPLLKKGRPDAEQMLSHFYHFYDVVRKNDNHDTDRVLSYLLATPEWEINPPTIPEGKTYADYANQMRLALVIICLIQKTKQRLPELPKETLIAFRKELPYWDRTSTSPLALFLRFRDQMGLLGPKLKNASSKFSMVKEYIDIFIVANKNKTLGELLDKIDLSQPPKEERPESGVSLKEVEKHLRGLPQDDPTHLPFEKEEILRLIQKEADVDKEKVRDMLTIIRESESRGFSVLDIRGLAENMRMIEKTTQQMQTSSKKALSGKVDFFLEDEVESLQKKLKEEITPFSGVSTSVKQLHQAKLENLRKKCEIAKTYFPEGEKISPALQEEHHQLQMGLSAAEKILEQELQQKISFTEEEQSHLETYLSKHLFHKTGKGIALGEEESSLVKQYQNYKKEVLKKIKDTKLEELPPLLRDMRSHPDLYTDFDLLRAVENLYKQIPVGEWLSKDDGKNDLLVTQYLLLQTTWQQFQHAWNEWQKNPSEKGAAKALEYIENGLQMDRYAHPGEEIIYRKCLVGEARGEIIYRPGQRELIQSVTKDPQQWLSLRMGLGKTSYALPTIAEILSDMGRSVVLTVPEKLLKSNRKDLDRTTRTLFDQAGIEFSLPLKKNLPLSYLSEKVLQVQRVFQDKGYVITSVEELATLQNTCILLEEERRKLCEKIPGTDEEKKTLLFVELRLHYYRKLYRLLSGTATELNMSGIFFGDEADDTHHLSHEVNIALGEKVDLSKTVREAAHIVLETIFSAKPESSLVPLKEGLVHNTYPVLTPKEIQNSMEEVAKQLLQSPGFLGLCGKQKEKIQTMDPKEWAGYVTGTSSALPKGLPPWGPGDPQLVETQKLIGAVKQILTTTLPSFLAQKSGNDFGLSDYDGFSVVPKITRNETQGMRYGDEFEMVLAQYLGYLEYNPSLSLSDAAPQFLEAAVKSLKEKAPSSYKALWEEYQRFVEEERTAKRDVLPLLDYLKQPQAYPHRWAVLGQIVLDGGYLKRYKEQVRTNVQEIFHRKACGGITGTLDPYVLPFISDEVQLRTSEEAQKTSTRLVEAETFLRLGINQEKGLDQDILSYRDEDVLKEIDGILQDSETTALINSSGETSEGLDTLAWVARLRQLAHGKNRGYLFLHPKERIYYLWAAGEGTHPVAYQKGQVLPKGVICLYAPSDVRGVDLPIQKGKAHMLGSSTSTPQELVQTLYRCRQLGGDHQLSYHLPQSLTDKLQKPTYGGTLQYLIERSHENTLQMKLQAQLLKIQLDVKTSVTKFLMETNPDLDQTAKMSREGFEEMGRNAMLQQNFFQAVRSLYIQEKEIDFAAAYQPRVLIAGKKKILDTFAATKKQIQDLQTKITEAGVKNLQINLSTKDVISSWKTAFSQLEVGGPAHKLIVPAMTPFFRPKSMLSGVFSLFSPSTSQTIDMNKLFTALSTLQQSLRKEICKKDPSPTEKQLQELRKWEAMTTEIIYGKGKTPLYHTLSALLKQLENQEKSFEKNFEKFHRPHLPETTAQTISGSAGCSEQVKELQQEKAQVVEKQDADPEKMKVSATHDRRTYSPLDPFDLLHSILPGTCQPLGTKSPWDKIYISVEARAILEVLPTFKGDPLVYFAVDTTDPKQPRITLISKLDYHLQLKDRLTKEDDFQNLTVYLPTPTGVRWVNGGKKRQISDTNPPDVQQLLLTAKVYLGYHEEFVAGSPPIEKWKNLLRPEEKEAILEHVRMKGSSSQGVKLRALWKPLA